MDKWRETNAFIQEDDFEIDDFLVQPRLNQIVRSDGTKIRITPYQRKILFFLAKHPRQVKTKSEIFDEIDPEHETNEGSLQNAISALRRVFGETGQDPKIIVTAGGGYMLTPPVVWLKPAPSLASALEKPPVLPTKPNIRRWLVGIASSLVGLAVILWQLFSTGSPVRRTEEPQKREGVTEFFQKAEKLYIRAEEALYRQEYDEAIDLLRKAIEQEPDYADAYELLAKIYNITGMESLALEAIDTALELAERQGLDRSRRLVYQRRKAQIEGNFEREIEIFRELIAIKSDPEWHHNLGWLYLTHRRDCDRSVARHEEAIGRSGDDPNPVYYAYFGEALLACGRIERALEVHKDYVETSSVSAEARRLLGRTYVISGRYDEAEKQLEKADSHAALLTRGELYLARGSYAEAYNVFYDYFLQSEAQPNKESEAYRHMALVDLLRGDVENAIAQAEKALVRKAKRALDHRADSAPAYWVLGLAHLELSDLPKAQDAADKILELRSKSPNDGGLAHGSLYGMEYFHHLQGKIAQQQGRLGEAVDQFRRALELHPIQRALFADSLAEALVMQGEPVYAEEEYHRIFEFNPNYGRSRCGLAKLYQSQNRLQEASAQYEECLKVFGNENQQEPFAVEAREQLAILTAQLVSPGNDDDAS